jgi:hypothetical protein
MHKKVSTNKILLASKVMEFGFGNLPSAVPSPFKFVKICHQRATIWQKKIIS